MYNLRFNLQLISIVLFMGLLSSCKEDAIEYRPNPTPNPLTTIYAEIFPEENSTRAVTTQVEDKWSFTNFSNNGGSNPDKIGFYSLYGNRESEGGNGSFTNEPMIYQGPAGSTFSSFTSSTMDCDISLVVWNKTAAYFPYTDQMEIKGLELRRTAESENDLRCIDMLFMSNLNKNGSQGVAGMSARFSHAFSEIIFLRGEGFDSPKNPEITVVLDRGYSHAKIVDNKFITVNNLQDSWKMVSLVYEENYRLSEEDCREWKAWKGGAYNGEEAYYVIIPTMYYTDRCKVSYIKIWDNYGKEHNISAIPLYNGGNTLYNGHRYPVEIKMEELVPTIHPYEILDWDEDQDVTETHAAGISSAADFAGWINDYNAFLNDGSKEDDLLKYGDKIIASDGSIHWHFYITDDFDCNNDDVYKNLYLSELKDILDGQHNTVSNLFLNKSLIGNIIEGGEIINLSFDALTVTSKETEAIGALAKNIQGGIVTGCKIDATVISEGAVGILTGSMSSGSVEGNSFTGLLIGKETSTNPKGLSGTEPGGTISDNNLSGVLFTQK